MSNIESPNMFMSFFTNTVARAFIGVRDWKDSEEIKQASVRRYLTTDFPATYITDGNTYSFQEQGMAFADTLSTLNVPVDTLFYDDLEKEITHEYQFNYALEEAQ